MDKNQQIEKFANLYRGLDRARGIWHKENRMETVREKPGIAHFKAHLEGSLGLGIVPIMDDQQCWWGAIDIDAHEEDDFIDILALDLKVESLGLPLMVCQSKSRGAHLYLFLKEPISASYIQSILKAWAANLGHPGVEVFPKQNKLHKNQLGNWINLPYFSAKDTIRYAVKSGNKLTLTEFITIAESIQVSKSELKNMAGAGGSSYDDAPPCVQHLLTNGIEAGNRNNAMFAVATYFKMKGVGDMAEALNEINYDKTILAKALPKKEIDSIIGSLSRQDYNYRCNEVPICNICDEELCKKREFGVEAGKTKLFDTALWGGLTKILSEPPRWVIEVSGIQIELTTEDLMEYRRVRKVVLEKVDLVIPPMKAEDWLIILRDKVETMTEISAPEDAGPGAIVGAMMDEFCRTAERFGPDGTPVYGKRDELLRGLPVMVSDEDIDKIQFRAKDFIVFLKRKRCEEAKGAALWSILRNLGCQHEKIRVGHTVIQVWVRPYVIKPIEFSKPEIVEKF